MVAMALFVRSGKNPAPTQRVGQGLVEGAGFTPARIECPYLSIAQIGFRNRQYDQFIFLYIWAGAFPKRT